MSETSYHHEGREVRGSCDKTCSICLCLISSAWKKLTDHNKALMQLKNCKAPKRNDL